MNQSAAIQEIETAIQAMAELWNRHDVKAYADLWTEDCRFVNVVGMFRNGRRELLAEIEYLHAGRFKNTQIHIERQSIRFLAPEVALANVWWQMSGDPGQPGFSTQNGERRGIFTHVAVKTPQGWRFTASQNTDSLPIPDPLQMGAPQSQQHALTSV